VSDILLTAYNGAILGPIAKLLGWMMNGIYYLMDQIGIGNVGLATILFTIVIYIFMFPLTYKQQKFSKLSQKMQPELQAIQKKYSNKKDQASMMAMQEETQAVYEKYGVSMMGSCAQMLIQMPILFALYRVFMNAPAYLNSVKSIFTEPIGGNPTSLVDGIMASDGFADKMASLVSEYNIVTTPRADFTTTDASSLADCIVDVTYKMNNAGWESLKTTFPDITSTIDSVHAAVSDVNTFIVYNISDTPWQIIKENFSSHAYLMVIAGLLIPVIAYLTQVLNIKLMPQASSNNTANNGNQQDAMAQQMKMMNNTMPLFSLVMCFTVPVGLGIYWIASALVRSFQQFVLNKHFEKMNLDDIIKKNQEKAKKKRAKMGISENQIYNAARINTRKIENAAKVNETSEEKEEQLNKANEVKSKAKPGSMAAKANMVREYNEKNNKK
jgi:YidC/Oxa1 family membrane protein insertase